MSAIAVPGGIATPLANGYYRAILATGQTVDFGNLTISPLSGFVVLGPHKQYPAKPKYTAFTVAANTTVSCHINLYSPYVGSSLMIRGNAISSYESATSLT